MRTSRISALGAGGSAELIWGDDPILESSTALLRHERPDSPPSSDPHLYLVADAPVPKLDAAEWTPCTYQPSRRAQGPAAGVALLIVGGLIASLTYLNSALPAKHKTNHLAIFSLPLTPPPPPKQPVQQPVVTQPTPPQIVAPPPIVAVQTPPPPVLVTTPVPPPPVIVPSAPAAPGPTAPAAPPAVADGGDLSSKMIFAKPPSYPLESRRRHEEGVVVLSVLVSVDGLVSDISVAQTSGSTMLDQAALSAVRKWRWAPLVRSGQAVMVQGQVKIPFVLKR